MPKKINVLLVEPGKPPRMVSVKNTLKAFSEMVGGPVEIGCYLPQRVLMFCRENGKGLGLPLNRTNPYAHDDIAGTFLLCGFNDNDFISLTPAQQSEFRKYFARPVPSVQTKCNQICFSAAELAAAYKQ